MFDRAINKRNNNSFKNNEKKFIIWFNLEKNIEKKYNPQNFQELLDDTKKCYKELKKPNEIYYEKKKLELKINNRFNNISLSQYFSNLLTLFALFFATIISIYAGLKFNDDATKNKNLLIMLKTL